MYVCAVSTSSPILDHILISFPLLYCRAEDLLVIMEGMKPEIRSMLQGIERYNPENIKTLEHYVDLQAREKDYDLEANLALLKLYQFNPTYNNLSVVVQILLKALTNLPHTDFVLCKCLLSQELLEDSQVNH